MQLILIDRLLHNIGDTIDRPNGTQTHITRITFVEVDREGYIGVLYYGDRGGNAQVVQEARGEFVKDV